VSVTILTLDPAHPTLDDHRPGGHPLFGTAMGIGALIEAGAVSGHCVDACRARVVQVRAPYILDHPGPHRLTVELGASGEATVRSPGQPGRADVVHFEGHIGQGVPLAPWQAPMVPDLGPAHAVDQQRIYQAFFHGPTFQVVRAARFWGSALFARLADPPVPGAIAQVCRLIEFGLQSAGLLELAISGRMMIPSAIDSLDIIDLGRPLAGADVFAHATQESEAAGTTRSDIAIWAKPGVLLMQISGYRTVELPFPMELQKIAELRDNLRKIDIRIA